MNKITDTPLGNQIRFVIEATEREKGMRKLHLKGKNRELKMQESDDCLECLANIEKHFRKKGEL